MVKLGRWESNDAGTWVVWATGKISFKFDSIPTFSFDLAFVYDVFYPPVVKLGCQENDEVGI
jgi:hypothetical protein